MKPARLPALVLGLAVAVAAIVVARDNDDRRSRPRTSHHVAATSSAPATSTTSTTNVLPAATTTTTTTAPRHRSDTLRLQLARTINGQISPKSVDANGHGLVAAQNMMYTHTVTVYDRNGYLVATVPDSVTLADFGITGHPGVSRGAPVEGAFSPNGRYLYVSNYSMYGAGFGPEGSDGCGPVNSYDNSFVYRIDTRGFVIDQVIAVGKVPKFVAMSPDGRTLLVTNWCSYDLSIVDVATHREIARIPIGRTPRGIAISRDSATAYIAVMGGGTIAIVDIASHAVSYLAVGAGPRHVVLSPTGRYLYVTLNDEASVVKIDTTTRTVVGRARVGSAPRSMAIAADGRSLYVVNYNADTISKVRATDMTVLQTTATQHHPIGITFDRTTGRVWVACYTGAILVFDDRAAA